MNVLKPSQKHRIRRIFWSSDLSDWRRGLREQTWDLGSHVERMYRHPQACLWNIVCGILHYAERENQRAFKRKTVGLWKGGTSTIGHPSNAAPWELCLGVGGSRWLLAALWNTSEINPFFCTSLIWSFVLRSFLENTNNHLLKDV